MPPPAFYVAPAPFFGAANLERSVSAGSSHSNTCLTSSLGLHARVGQLELQVAKLEAVNGSLRQKLTLALVRLDGLEARASTFAKEAEVGDGEAGDEDIEEEDPSWLFTGIDEGLEAAVRRRKEEGELVKEEHGAAGGAAGGAASGAAGGAASGAAGGAALEEEEGVEQWSRLFDESICNGMVFSLSSIQLNYLRPARTMLHACLINYSFATQ